MTIGTAFLLLLAQAATPPAAPKPPEVVTRAMAEAEIRAVFETIDANKDGKIERSEANAFHAAQRAAIEKRQREAGEATFTRADTNKDGVLNRQEFLAAARPLPPSKDLWFDANDTDRNGRVDLVEAISRVQRNFDTVDTNRDGRLTAQELSAAAARNAQAQARAATPTAAPTR